MFGRESVRCRFSSESSPQPKRLQHLQQTLVPKQFFNGNALSSDGFPTGTVPFDCLTVMVAAGHEHSAVITSAACFRMHIYIHH